MSDQYPPPSYPPPSGGGNDPNSNWPGGNQGQNQPPQYGQEPSYGQQYPQQPVSSSPYDQPVSGNPYPTSPPGYGDPAAAGAYGAPPPAPPKKRSVGKIIGIVLGVLALLSLICCGGLYFLARDTFNEIVGQQPDNAKVGDCLAGDSIDPSGRTETNLQVRIVDCTSADAKHKVYGRVEDKTFAQASEGQGAICEPYIDAGAESYIWLGDATKLTEPAAVLCVGPPK